MFKKLALALLLGFLAVAPAEAQQTRSQLVTNNQTSFPANNVGAITPTILQNYNASLLASIPCLFGDTACLPLTQFPAGVADQVFMGGSPTAAYVGVPNCPGSITYSTGTHTWGCTALGPYATAVQGQMPGNNTGAAATAGNIGEYITSSIPIGSAVALTNGVAANITSVSLTTGDWDCRGNVVDNPAGTTNVITFYGWISTTSAAIPTAPNGGAESGWTGSRTGTNMFLSVASAQFLLSSPTTVYLSTSTAFSVSTDAAYGFLGCRRVR